MDLIIIVWTGKVAAGPRGHEAAVRLERPRERHQRQEGGHRIHKKLAKHANKQGLQRQVKVKGPSFAIIDLVCDNLT